MYPYPATIYSYNANTRQCRIEIEGLTSGSEDKLLAELLNPIGDKGEHTELELKKGDKVWVTFIGGDARYPLIIGYRNQDSGNSSGWRRYHHANIELNADGTLLLKAPDVTIECDTLTVNGDINHTGDMTNDGDISSTGTIKDSDGINTA